MKHAVRASSKKPHLYSNRQLIALMLPLICEQIFTSFMGTVDSMMVSNVSEAAISAVSLVDSINILVIQAFLRPGLRRCHCLCQLSWPETAGSGGTLCQPASVYYFRHLSGCAGSLPAVPGASSPIGFRLCGTGGHGRRYGVLFLHLSVLSFYRAF